MLDHHRNGSNRSLNSSRAPKSVHPLIPPLLLCPTPPTPVAPPSASTAGTTNHSTAFQPYSGQGAPFPPSTGYTAPRPAFGPPTCPYPTQQPFPAPPLGQFGPMAAPYPSPYTYGGYSYPTGPHGPSTQSPTARPLYRPGFGVPQPYS